MADPTQFAAYERAADTSKTIYRTSRWRWVVHFAESDHAHPVRLVEDGDDWRGVCECRYHEKTGRTCAHLWAIYLAHSDGFLDVANVNDAFADADCPTCGQAVDVTNA